MTPALPASGLAPSSARHLARLLVGTLALGALLLTPVGGCAEGPTRMEMHAVTGPEGGNLLTVAVTESEPVNTVFTPLPHSLFVGAGERWRLIDEFEGFRDAGFRRPPFSSLVHEGRRFNYPRDQLFTSWKGALWMLVQEPSLGRARLMRSRDGQRWSEVELPEKVEDADAEAPPVDRPDNAPRGDGAPPPYPPPSPRPPSPRPPSPTDALAAPDAGADGAVEPGRPVGEAGAKARPTGSIRATDVYRLRATTAGLFLLDSHHVWRLDDSGAGFSWKPLDLEGVALAPQRPGGLPAVLRNYLPATDTRPYELLTVLRDQLLVYRRASPDQPWLMASLLGTVDRDLVASPTSDDVFLISPDSIYRAEDQAEQWVRYWLRSPAERPDPPPVIAAATIVPTDATDLGYALIVGTSDGALWRSEDAAASWTMTFPADRDARTITGLAYDPDANRLYASSSGRGMFVSEDTGRTWLPFNQELRGARPLDLAVSARGELLVATGAGLYRLAGDYGSGNWTRLQSRGTASLLVESRSGRIVSGTFSGDLIVHTDTQEGLVVDVPFGRDDSFDYVPFRLEDVDLGPLTVVDLQAGAAEMRAMAWSRQGGAAMSDDAGLTWRPFDLSDALVGALGSSRITDFVAGADDALFLLETPRAGEGRTMLWRSLDAGASWTAIHAFDTTPGGGRIRLRRRSAGHAGELYASREGVLQRTVDSGNTWTPIEGPWRPHQILGFDASADRLVLLVDSRPSLELMLLDGLDGQPSVGRRILEWPDAPPDPDSIRDVILHDGRVFITTGQQIFVGTIPEVHGPVPQAVTIIATLLVIFLATGLAFLALRRER